MEIKDLKKLRDKYDRAYRTTQEEFKQLQYLMSKNRERLNEYHEKYRGYDAAVKAIEEDEAMNL